MSLTASAIRLMASKGMSAEDIADIAEAMEAPMPVLTPGALRTRKWREKKDKASRGDVTVTHNGDVTGARVRDNSPKLVNSGLVGGGGETREADRDDWPDGNAGDHSASLVATIASPWLDPSKSPGLVTTRGRLVVWRRDGASWEHDVVPVVTALCAARRAPVSTWKFFDQAIARSIADNRQALAIPEAANVVPMARGQGPPSWADQQAASIAEARRRVLESD